MTIARTLIARHRALTLLLLAAALALKAIVPAGFMIDSSRSLVLSVRICTGTTEHTVRNIVVPRRGERPAQTAEKQAQPCAFASLFAGGPAGPLPAFVAAAILFVLALGFARVPRLVLRQPSYQRPRLRAPPA